MPRITQAEYAALLARSSQRTVDAAPSAAETSERKLHEDIRAECERRGWIAFHGSMAHRTHRTVGEPDFIILANAGRVLLVEAKARGGKLRPEQAALAAWAGKLGHEVWVVRSLGEFVGVVDGTINAHRHGAAGDRMG